ncbi:dihydrofolate reductase family protein [Aeromicrobium sp. CTD01-1L150]|uniref:dihydrofolate reductase family protein n=1 Tax=Aeromicrobium sp. CTD01-1L150 TaxID=3341830 RepID=UPI0035C1ADE0
MLIVQNMVTADGFAADSAGTVDFVLASTTLDERDEHNLSVLEEVDAIVLGRRTYEMFVVHWPDASGPLADFINRTPRLVVSDTLGHAPWGGNRSAEVISGGVPSLLEAVGSSTAIVWGSLTLVADLLAAGAVDRLWLETCPVMLGEGRRHPSARAGLSVRSVTRFTGGLVSVMYDVDTAVFSAGQ